jgi:hypothetical protein
MAGGSGFGAFAGGLWQGASSVMQLASAYQSYQRNEAILDAQQKYQEAIDAATKGETNQPPQPPASDTTTQATTTTQAIPDSSQTAPDASSPDMRERNAPVSPETTAAAPKPAGKPTAPTVTPKTRTEEVWYQLGLSDAAIRQREAIATGQQTSLGQSTPPSTPQAGPGVTERQGYDYHAPVISTPQTAPSQGVVQAPVSVAPSNMPTYDVPMTQPGALSSGQGTTQGTAAQAPPAALTPQAPPRQTVMPGPNVPSADEQSQGTGLPSATSPPVSLPSIPGRGYPAPAGGAPVVAPGPGAQAQPPQSTTVGRIASALNPNVQSDVEAMQAGVERARAARTGGAGVSTAQVAGAAGAPSGVPEQPTATATVNAAVGGNAPIAAPTRATPPTRPAPAQPQPASGVTTVSGKTGQVTAGQQGPSVQSEATPPKVYTQSHTKFDRLSPDDQALLRRVSDQEGDNGHYVSPYILAEVWDREGGLKSSVRDWDLSDPSGPALGPFQVHRAVWQQLDPSFRYDPKTGAASSELGDPRSLDASARMAVRYYRYLTEHEGYPPQSPAQSAAYMAGAGGARGGPGALRANQIGWTQGIFPDWKPTDPPTAAGWNNKAQPSDQQVLSGVVNAAHQQGPDGALRYLAQNGPVGMGMSQLWRNAESAGIRLAILSGNMNSIPQIHEWFAQQAHQGALSNLASAWQAMRGGNSELAAQFVAKAHAFFPDYSYIRTGVDNKGRLFAEQFDEGSGKPMGQPMEITQQALEEQMLQLRHPDNFIEALQQYRKTNAEISKNIAETGWYQARPAIEGAKLDLRQQQLDATTALRLSGQQQASERHQDALDQQAQQERQHVDDRTDKAYARDANGDERVPRYKDQTDQQYAHQQEAERYLQYSRRAGGAGLGQGVARSLAQQFSQGKLNLVPGKDENGKPAYGLYDSEDKEHKEQRGTLSKELGDQLLSLPGVGRRAGAATVQPSPDRRAAIGAGMGTAYAMNQPGAGNFGGIPTTPLPQTQQPSMAA